ncbi:Multidrug resistance-associated protein 1 [Rhizoclosmatium hyalinum]|nr:Multidrug resistance-associated protein 1 [Rhizoclosmatium hyalinum]
MNVPGLWELAPIPNNLIKGFPLITKSTWSLAFLILGLKLSATLFGRTKDFIIKRSAFNIRTVLINAVTKKALTVSSSESNEFSNGYILNLINVDCEAVSIFAEQVHELWAIPLQLVLATALLAVMLGSSIGAGVGALSMFTAITSWNRIYNFLIAPDHEIIPDEPSETLAVSMTNATFNWFQQNIETIQFSKSKSSTEIDEEDYNEKSKYYDDIPIVPKPVLVNLNLHIQKGQFVAIVGPVGCGKSSLLSAILGDLEMGSGQTVLGEKGTSVSGGQKTRIALARAVYSDADIYLLDDPLSSLDARVSRTVFNDCFKTALKGKTILLATHNHDILKETDHIIFIHKSGTISQGTHNQLMKKKEFNDFVTIIESNKLSHSSVIENHQVSKSGGSVQNAMDQRGIIADEEMEVGNVKRETYLAYINACGGWPIVSILVTVIILKESATILSYQWLTWWSDNILLGESRDVYFWIGCTKSFHEMALKGVMNAPIWWFESQQIGRIMNRFTKDMAAIDQRMITPVFQFIGGVGALCSIAVILAINAPWLLVGVVPLTGMYLYVLRYYRSAMRQLKRLESVQRSPLYSHICEAIEGVSTIRAFNKESFFCETTNKLLDISNSPMFFKMGAELWVILRLEILSSLLVFVLASQCTNPNFISSSAIGIALIYTNPLTSTLNLVLQSAANLETEMVCVERLVEYSEKLPLEGEQRLPSDPSKEEWPLQGTIEFKGVSAFYKSNPERPVLYLVNLTIANGERICVVGRTGSGKSTLISVLLRFVDKKGDVCIDGREIESVGFQTLREAMEVIPQDIYLFSGTLRTTLDRDSVFSDEQLWSSLESVGMKKFVANLEQKLDTPIENGGSNLSLGQRQLLYFARMLLLKPKIILMDEATSSVDPETETTLRQVIKEQFVGTTIIAVLHRLQTSVLEDFDKVLVMDAGNVAEFDAPRVLLERKGSLFAGYYNAHS